MKSFILVPVLTILTMMCDDTQTVEGYLQFFGSEPFPQIAVVSDEHGRLFIGLSEEKQDSLWNNQNRKEYIRITGEIYEGEYLGKPHPYIKPEKWEWIEKPD